MQMTGQARRELQDLINAHNWRHGRKPKSVSFSTQDNRAQTLWLIFRQLHQKLNRPMMPRSFRLKHVAPLVQLWERQGLSAATLQTRFSYLNTFATWIGKPGLIPGTLADYLNDPQRAARTYAAQYDKSWEAKGVDAAAMIDTIAAYDRYVGAQLRLQRALGLRAKEACMCRPHESDQGCLFQVTHGTKGGRARTVPIDTPEKRAAIDQAKHLVALPNAFLGDPQHSLKQTYDRYRNTLAKFGITKAQLGVTGHGLRAGYGLTLYQQETGAPAPVRGGAAVAPDTDRAARLKVAQHYGHGRTAISTAYLGGVLQQRWAGAAEAPPTAANHDPS